MSEESYNYDILTLIDEEGNEQQFELVDRVEIEGEEYVGLVPIYDDSDDFLDDSGELVILRVGEDEETGEEYLDSIDDDTEYNTVSEVLIKRLDDVFDFEFDEDDDFEDDEED